MSDNTTPRVNELIGVTRDKLYTGEPAYGMSRDWRASYKEVVDLARQLERELRMDNVASLRERAESAEAQLAAMAEALKRIATYINGRRETASEMLFDIISIAEKAKANLPERAKLLLGVVQAAIEVNEWNEPPGDVLHKLDEAVRAYQSAKDK